MIMKEDEIINNFRKADRFAFRTREYAALTKNPAYAAVRLHRLHKKGVIRLVRRGWWALSDAMPEAVACEISAPAYVSFHTALHLLGLTTQPYRRIQVAILERNAKRYKVLGEPVQEYQIKKKQFHGYARRDGLMLAEPEKAVADALSVPKSCPEIILREALATVNGKKVGKYLSSQAAEKRLEKLMKDA